MIFLTVDYLDCCPFVSADLKTYVFPALVGQYFAAIELELVDFSQNEICSVLYDHYFSFLLLLFYLLLADNAWSLDMIILSFFIFIFYLLKG